MKNILVLLLVFCTCYLNNVFAQPAIRTITANRLNENIKIDGTPDEPGWKQGALITDLAEFRPKAGDKEKPGNTSEIWLLYDNTAIYVGGICHDTLKNVSKELAGRDNIGVSDYVGVIFDTYHDRINAVGFYVTTTGEQFDARYSPGDNGEDQSWNAVYETNAKITDEGWTFEMRIPFSALRFNKKPSQLWGFNLIRQRMKFQQGFTWNPLDLNKAGFVNQFGDMIIPDQITPPLRLSFSPYFSSYINHYPYNSNGVKNTTASVNGGMDLKYGINESFTLDMTLIPDFGQVQSDNQVLNLTPFEIKYNENRSFFTEGTELFNKGDLFYSRRVGATPIHYYDVSNSLQPGERILRNPSETKLINATKISGRTKKGLGIGVFNALTRPMHATIENSAKQKSNIETQPLTNYSILVFDQNMKNNSSITFLNTNVTRNGNDYDANVSALLFNFFDKKNTFNLFGRGYTSTLFNYNNKNISGYSYKAGFGKVSGEFTFELKQELTDDKYDPNDLGILFNNNFIDNRLYVGYRKVKPGKWYNRMFYNLNLTYSQRFTERTYQVASLNANFNGQLKNLWYIGMFTNLREEGNDFYEPRVKGKVFRSPRSAGVGGFFESPFAKKYFAFSEVYFYKNRKYGWGQEFRVGHRYRVNDKISFFHDFTFMPGFNNVGFTEVQANDVVIFARRDRSTIENVLNLKYSFNNRMFITTRIRHYWSKVKNREFFTLNDKGYLDENMSYVANKDLNANIFNIDMVYSWRFAPGSEFNLVWKNSVYENTNLVETNYLRNFRHTLDAPQNNSLSLKVLYYIDYLSLKKNKK